MASAYSYSPWKTKDRLDNMDSDVMSSKFNKEIIVSHKLSGESVTLAFITHGQSAFNCIACMAM